MGYEIPSTPKEVTLEEKIKAVLEPLIKEAKKEIFINPENETDEDTLGIILAKYLDWDGYKIKAVAEAAFEDANFSDVNIEID
jgi:hypothetical protein